MFVLSSNPCRDQASGPLSSEFCKHKPVKAIFWPWFEPYSRHEASNPFKVQGSLEIKDTHYPLGRSYALGIDLP